MKVKTPNAEQKILYLSGGNQQKAILRPLAVDADESVAARRTHAASTSAPRPRSTRSSITWRPGIAVIVVSSDLMEVMGISDRILVLCEGAMRGEQTRAHATESNLLQLALPRGWRTER
jgi:L-arabinose transport system ATP-binding protein